MDRQGLFGRADRGDGDAAALHRLRARQKKLTVFGFAELRTSTKHLGTLAGLVEVEAITMPKPGKKNYPPRADGFSR